MKECSKCKEKKSLDCFYKEKRAVDGKASACKDCVSTSQKKYYQKNKKRIIKRVKGYIENNKEKHYEWQKKYLEKNRQKRNDWFNEWRKEKYKNDPLYKLTYTIRNYCGDVTRAVKQQKELRSLEYLGCTIEEFKTHIESLWLDGMTWENHGDWHIDHKIPLDYFVKNEDDPWEANHYSNLQPLWAEENLRKGNSI